MSSSVVPLRLRRLSIASIVLVIALLVSPLLGVHAAPATWLQANIVVASGAVLGTATFTPGPTGGVTVHVQVRGFDPVAGSHRLTITNVGNCCPPYFNCSGNDILVLPDMQFNADGSADYTTTTTGMNMDWLTQPSGSSIVIRADTNASSPVIGCGAIWPSAYQQPGWCPPGGQPGWSQPPYQQPPYQHPPYQRPPQWQHPRPAPQPAVVGNLIVTAGLGLRLRSGPGTGYAVLRTVSVRTVLGNTGIEQWGNGYLWTKVVYNGAYYWAARQYLAAY